MLPVAVLSKPTAKIFPEVPWHDGYYTEVAAAGVCVCVKAHLPLGHLMSITGSWGWREFLR